MRSRLNISLSNEDRRTIRRWRRWVITTYLAIGISVLVIASIVRLLNPISSDVTARNGATTALAP